MKAHEEIRTMKAKIKALQMQVKSLKRSKKALKTERRHVMEALKKANALNGELQHELAKYGGEC